MVRPQAKLNQRSRIRQHLGLPAMIFLVTAHGFLRTAIPASIGFTAQVVLLDERFLDLACAVGIDAVLALRLP